MHGGEKQKRPFPIQTLRDSHPICMMNVQYKSVYSLRLFGFRNFLNIYLIILHVFFYCLIKEYN